MKQWTRVIALKKKKAAINFMTILNPTYWPLVGDKAKQFHTGDTVKLSIPNSFGPEESGGGNVPQDIVKLRENSNGATGKIISIDQVEGIPGSDAEAMTIQLNNGERLDKFPAAWVVKASKMFKIKKASDQNKIDIVINSLYGLETSVVLDILRDFIDPDCVFEIDQDEFNNDNYDDIFEYLEETYPTSEGLWDDHILNLENCIDENTADKIIDEIRSRGLVVVEE